MLSKIIWDFFRADKPNYDKYYMSYGFNDSSRYFYEECFYEYLFMKKILDSRNHMVLPYDAVLGEIE